MKERGRIAFNDNSLKMFLNFRREVMMSFYEKGWDIFIIVPLISIDQSLSATVPEDIKIIGIDFEPNKINPLTDLRYFIKLLRIIRKINPNIIFNYTIKPNIYGSIAAKFLRVKCISMVAGLGYVFSDGGFTKKIGRWLYRYGLRRSDYVLVLNRSNYDVLLSGSFVDRNKLILMTGGEGVDLEKFYPGEKQDFSKIRFLLIGRLLYPKGYKEFVGAAKIIKNSYPSVNFEVIGSMGGDSPMAVNKIELNEDIKQGLIDYKGEIDSISQLLKEPGVVVVLPSYYPEGLNRTLMEACASGVPLITTDNPGCVETVDDGVNGLIIKSKNTESLVDALLRFIKLAEEEKKKMGIAGREKAMRSFDISKTIEIYHSISISS